MSELLQPGVWIPWLLAMVFGVFVGATPGLTATMAVALIVPVSYYMDPNAALAMIIGVSFTAIFAGDIPATWLRIPGTPASAAATLDGYAMARKGRGDYALTLNLFCSAIGGVAGVLLLMVLAPQLARFALRFSNFEYFWLAALGLSLSAMVSGGAVGKGLLAAAAGVLLATVGMDGISGTPRYTFGSSELLDGIGFIPAMIGLFGLSEVLRTAWSGAGAEALPEARAGALPVGEALRGVWRRRWTVARSSALGTVVGALPGAGADIAAWGAYGLERRISKRGKEFGQGCEEGVVAPTSANNAAVAGAWIPALVFGIPGDAVTAIVLGAFLVYDIRPGPEIFEHSGERVRNLFVIALATQVLLLAAGYAGLRAFRLILRLPRAGVMAGVVVFSIVGSYALRNSVFDVGVAVIFGFAGFLFDRQKVPLAPLILGMILGPMAEKKLRAGLISAKGDPTAMFQQPVCLVLMLMLAALWCGPLLARWKGWTRLRKNVP
ncbi:MAG TPA: tripartite tricarboxylate transporter permease [Verrucomicrobiales bacterium]|nr:tripartite tricarboxylate transporter permease [Verrucomicrobiales bacterium]